MADAIRSRTTRLFHEAFEASVLAKGLFAAAEALLGVGLYFVANDSIRHAVRWLTTHELTEDPTDAVAHFLLERAQGFSIGTQDFYATYLIAHGVLKLLVVFLLVRGIVWAYPFAVIMLSGFVVYQVHRFMTEPALGLVFLTVFDLVVIALTLIEYRRLKTTH
jgi:uncharacterized membrane protein